MATDPPDDARLSPDALQMRESIEQRLFGRPTHLPAPPRRLALRVAVVVVLGAGALAHGLWLGAGG